MLTVIQAIRELIEQNGLIHFGLAHQLLNLSQTAKWIQPLVQTRTQKEVSISAIVMALSRIGRSKSKAMPQLDTIKLNSLTVHKDLTEFTFDRTAKIQSQINEVYREVHNKKAYIVITQGVSEITIITESKMSDILKKIIKNKPKVIIKSLAAIGMQFDEKYIDNVGMVYYLIQQITLQNINILEFSSTYTELTFYIKESDLKLAFNTLNDRFL